MLVRSQAAVVMLKRSRDTSLKLHKTVHVKVLYDSISILR